MKKVTFYVGDDFLGGMSVSVHGLKHPWDVVVAV